MCGICKRWRSCLTAKKFIVKFKQITLILENRKESSENSLGKQLQEIYPVLKIILFTYASPKSGAKFSQYLTIKASTSIYNF